MPGVAAARISTAANDRRRTHVSQRFVTFTTSLRAFPGCCRTVQIPARTTVARPPESNLETAARPPRGQGLPPVAGAAVDSVGVATPGRRAGPDGSTNGDEL